MDLNFIYTYTPIHIKFQSLRNILQLIDLKITKRVRLGSSLLRKDFGLGGNTENTKIANYFCFGRSNQKKSSFLELTLYKGEDEKYTVKRKKSKSFR